VTFDNVKGISVQYASLQMSLLDVIVYDFICAVKQHKCTAASLFAVDNGEDSCEFIDFLAR